MTAMTGGYRTGFPNFHDSVGQDGVNVWSHDQEHGNFKATSASNSNSHHTNVPPATSELDINRPYTFELRDTPYLRQEGHSSPMSERPNHSVQTTAITPMSESDSLLDLYNSNHQTPQDPSREPLRGILRHNLDDDVPSEVGSGEREGSIKSVSSVAQSPAEAQQRDRKLPSTMGAPSNDISPIDQDSQQINFSRPKRMKPGVSRIPVSKSSPLSKSPPMKDSPDSSYTPSRKGSIKRARNSLEALDMKRNRLSTASVDGAEELGRPMTPEVSTPTMPMTPVMPRVSSLASRDASKRRSVPDSKGLARGGRIISGQERPRTASASHQATANLTQRPRTSSTPKRPVNRPEGEPPWIATMFKPDPRLPQEQQILPTHAKRLAIEQGTFIPPTYVLDEDVAPPRHTGAEQSDAFAIPKRSSSLKNLFRRASQKSRASQDAPLPTEMARVSVTVEQESGEAQWPLRTPSPEETRRKELSNIHRLRENPPLSDIPTGSEAIETIPSTFNTVEPTPPPAASTVIPRERVSTTHPTITSAPPATNTNMGTSTRIPEKPLMNGKEEGCGCCIVM